MCGPGCSRSLSAVATIALASPSLAADPKPDAVIKNRNIDARIFLDDKIKADAALAADCLAEGKKWLDKNATDAAALAQAGSAILQGRRLGF